MVDENTIPETDDTLEQDVEAAEADTEEEEPAEEELSEDEKLLAKLKEAISVEKEEVGSLRLKLTVAVPRDMLDERMTDQFQELKREAVVPGFRKGRAPLRLIQKRFGSDVGNELVAQLVENGYSVAIEKEELDPIGEPLIWSQFKEERTSAETGTRSVDVEKLLPIHEAIQHMKMPKEGPLRFACEVDLKPKFELPELIGIPLKRPSVAVSDADVQKELDYLRSLWGTFKPVEEGGIKKDDLLYADVNITVDGEPVFDEQNIDLPARDTMVHGIFMQGLGEAVIGKTVGETATLEVTVPADHENIDIRGRTATVSVAPQEIKRLELAPMTAELLESIGMDSEDDLRASIRKRMESQLEAIMRRPLREQVLNYLTENTQMELPEGFSHRLVERSVQSRMMQMYRANLPQVEIDKEIDKLRSTGDEKAAQELKQVFILEKVAEQLDVQVGEDEINGAIGAIAERQNKRFDRVRDELSRGEGMVSLYLQIRDEKVLDKLVEDASITETQPGDEPGPKEAGE